MKYLLLTLTAAFTVLQTLTAATPFREATTLEKRLAAAQEECYRNYDSAEAHFKFAGVLYDAGCIESAFANVETLLRNSPTPRSREYFDKYCKRELKSFNIPHPPQTEKMSQAQYETYRLEQLRKLAKSDPAAAAFLRLARTPEKWRSKDSADIAEIKQQLVKAKNDPLLQKSLQFNTAAASFLYLAAKDHEAALPLFIRLYFHDPEQSTALQSPLGFTITRTIQRLSVSRRNHLWIASRRDAVKFIIDNMHIYPDAVIKFFRAQKDVMPKAKFVKLCLLATDSVDLQLRSFVFAELMKRDLTPLLPMLKSLLHDQNSGRRAVAAIILPHALEASELPEALAKLAKDHAAVVKMTAEAVAKARCQGGYYARFRELADRK